MGDGVEEGAMERRMGLAATSRVAVMLPLRLRDIGQRGLTQDSGTNWENSAFRARVKEGGALPDVLGSEWTRQGVATGGTVVDVVV